MLFPLPVIGQLLLNRVLIGRHFLQANLFTPTRRSQPASFRAGTENVDYLENQCIRNQELVKDYKTGFWTVF